ncbi:acetyl-CoA/propionyl-CoA carboxylase biotin carboxyl carrier protein [Arcanobacterium wilhelmae]|uniref:biotin carboxylase n=1 Tax=Arcanobacterium wilhelmae TaxID=1803177 RepID=A0ABT9NE33_9ACTO|nr:biotin carboxylase N-terminal domain-containing protein [Arcanobacterium wilhelmae]MDP9801456.1 acetyl-CoA/propionyl-CoA carboxylase biotin carboxyl carrier protein [Arcanobacterium wilhelmae]WFN90789.1 biotin carboxylase N-terminal domain-containing protein [Arcanobacterium wilhelmae]
MKIFVANRSEIAERVIRTAHDLGHTVAVGYSDSDREARFVRMADEAYALGGTTTAETYMNADKLVALAVRVGADALHPGYGFLSEVASFAAAVEEAGITWIGPSSKVLAALGDKISARQIAEKAGVSPVPGISHSIASRTELEAFVAAHGYPVVTKKADGGGGHGITIIRSVSDVDLFFAVNGHNLGAFFVEKFLEHAHHVETQSMRDSNGKFAVVSTRDCSIQRRNQKLIEEAPAPGLSAAVVAELERASRALFDTVGYEGLGTCEFLIEGENVYFMEVNPRLQVEHTVSEEVSGLDLVEQQIAIAQGKPAADVGAPHAHSFEFRINAENPSLGMRPAYGKIRHLAWPLGHGVRIESGIAEGDVVTADFDPMLAKVIVTGPTREAAIARSKRALSELVLDGVANGVQLYRDVLSHPDFANNNFSTRWFEESFLPAWIEKHPSAPEELEPEAPTERRETFTIEIDGKRVTLTLPQEMFGSANRAQAPAQARRRRSSSPARRAVLGESSNGEVASPMQAIVVRVLVEEGAEVAEGDLLVVLESMKMESYVRAPRDGVVKAVSVADGQTVAAGEILVKIG